MQDAPTRYDAAISQLGERLDSFSTEVFNKLTELANGQGELKSAISEIKGDIRVFESDLENIEKDATKNYNDAVGLSVENQKAIDELKASDKRQQSTLDTSRGMATIVWWALKGLGLVGIAILGWYLGQQQ